MNQELNRNPEISGKKKSLESFERLNQLAPLQESMGNSRPGSRQKSTLISREAILNRSERISGYEFSLGSSINSRLMDKSAMIRRIYDDTMLKYLASLNLYSLLEDRLAFIRIFTSSINNPALENLSAANVAVILVPDNAEEITSDEILERILKLKGAGIKHGWSIDCLTPQYEQFIQIADFVEIESTFLDGMQLKNIIGKLRSMNPHLKLIARNVQSAEEFQHCFQCGYDYFLGNFISSREKWIQPKVNVNPALVFELLNKLRGDEDLKRVADKVRTDPTLSFKLLKYVNSAGMGLSRQTNDIGQALLVLGREKFMRWLSLMIFDFKQPGYRERALQEQTLTKARFMELLAGEGLIPDEPNLLFMTGLLSSIEMLTGQSFLSALRMVGMPTELISEMFNKSGGYYDALQLGIAHEDMDLQGLESKTQLCELDGHSVTKKSIQAMLWCRQVIEQAASA